MIIIPYTLTFIIGTVSLKYILRNQSCLPAVLLIPLSMTTGISITIFITFFSFVFFNHFNLFFILFIHILWIATSLILLKPQISLPSYKPDVSLLLPAGIILFTGILSWIYVKNTPMGGWDAWTLWNFKSKFLLLSGTRWKALFDTGLSRFHPHYPIGLPLFNAWTWAFTEGTPIFAPLVNAVLFNILTAGLMIGFLQKHCTSKWIYLPILFLFLTPIYMIFMTNQYCDIVISIFLLAALGSIFEAHQSSHQGFFVLSGIFIGTLSFLKLEGALLSSLIFLGGHFYIFNRTEKIKTLVIFWLSTLIATLPMILFLLFLAPKDQSFINGLTSVDHPSTLLRFKGIMAGVFFQICSARWRYLWGGLIAAGLLYYKKIFQKDILIFPFIIIVYLGIVILQYWINTYYPINWWVQNSIGRVMAALFPSLLVWITISILSKKSSSN